MIFLIVFWGILSEIRIRLNLDETIFMSIFDKIWREVFCGILQRVIWIIPVIWLIKRYESDIKINLKNMFFNRINFKLFFTFFGFFTLYPLVSMFIMHGGFHVNKINFTAELFRYAMVGFVEELAYRGWALNAFSKFMSEKKANLISAIFFLLLHYSHYIRHWITTGTLNMNGTNNIFALNGFLSASIMIYVFGLLFGYIFRKNKSITSPMFIHSYYDFIYTIFVR